MIAEEKALGRPYCSLAVREEAHRKDKDRHFSMVCCNRARDSGFELKILFRLAIRNKFFYNEGG